MIGRRHILALALAGATAQLPAQVAYPPSATQVQTTTVTLSAGGTATWTFDQQFGGVPDLSYMPQAMDTTNPITCNYTARSATEASIRCWRTSLLGLLTNLYSGSVAGAQITLFARYRPN